MKKMLLLVGFVFALPVYAAEDTTLFRVSQMYPGIHLTKTIVLKNETSTRQRVMMKITAKKIVGYLPEVLMFTVYSHGQKLRELPFRSWTYSTIDLDSIEANTSQTYMLEVSIPESAGNRYQNSSIVFDLYMSITGTKENRYHPLRTLWQECLRWLPKMRR